MSTSEEPNVKPVITDKQARRINAPARSMIISMIVMVALLVPILLLSPQLTNTRNYFDPNVDIDSIAYHASTEAGYPVIAPEPAGWRYNFARWTTNQADKISYWNAGLLTDHQQYVEITQAKDVNPTWVANKTNNAAPQAQHEVAGVRWDERVYIDKDDKKTTYWVGEVKKNTVILSGDSNRETFVAAAQAVVDYANNPTRTVAPSPSGTSGIQ